MNIGRVSFGSIPFNEEKDSEGLRQAIINNQVMAVDVDTQNDFMQENGGLYVPEAAGIVENLKKITNLVKGKLFKVETMDTHKKDDPEFKDFPPHCIYGTPGWQKIDETKPDAARVVRLNDDKDAPALERIKQLIKNRSILRIEKNTYDLTQKADEKGDFHPNEKVKGILDSIKQAKIKMAIIYGVATDYCVKAAVNAFNAVDIKPIVISDAIKPVNKNENEGLDDETYENVITITTDQLSKVMKS